MNLHSWTGLAAANLTAGSKGLKATDRRLQAVSVMVAILLAAFAAIGLFVLLSGQ
jgi:hypothetical protein